uniref:RxLR effector candidate protein n=1 Tax=Hyaloperonospora arabidopsidis (strain Emoy2) TaxID=559515 RepID=M4B7Y1_HYAAE
MLVGLLPSIGAATAAATLEVGESNLEEEEEEEQVKLQRPETQVYRSPGDGRTYTTLNDVGAGVQYEGGRG